jgi:hypothetical protein
VEPNVLTNDPAIGSVEALPVPDAIVSAGSPAAEGGRYVRDSALSATRLEVLASMRVKTRSISEALDCGKRRVGATVDRKVLTSAEQCFGGEEFTVALVAVPREGGAYLPGLVDEPRAARPSFSVRLITVDVGSRGNTELAQDCVFEWTGSAWKLVRKRTLLIAG